jgi:hypothetical protein
MATQHMLTTIDNPFNPFTQFDEWYTYDTTMGYHTCAYLARITKSSNELSDADADLAIDSAMNEIIKFNILGTYLKVDESFIPRERQE